VVDHSTTVVRKLGVEDDEDIDVRLRVWRLTTSTRAIEPNRTKPWTELGTESRDKAIEHAAFSIVEGGFGERSHEATVAARAAGVILAATRGGDS